MLFLALYMASLSPLPEQTESTSTPSLSPLRKWSMLVVLSLALAIIILDTTILNVALSSIIRDLHTTIQKIQWVITAYSLTLAALTITGGRLGDLFGRKRMFVVGAVLFAIGSFLASMSTNVAMLVSGEAIIEGIGAALMMPATASLLVVNFRGRERAIAFGVWGAIAGAASALGPILGGYLTTHYNWRWGFRINLVVVLALLIGSFLIPESRDTEEKKELDFIGVFLSAGGMLSLVFGIIEASTYGWWKAKLPFLIQTYTLTPPWSLSVVPFFMALGVVILALFGVWEYFREKAGHTPLVSMGLFKNRRFTAGIATTAFMSLGQTGLIFALPVFLQAVRGFDAYQTGVALLPMSLALLVVAPLSAVLSKNISGRRLINLGLVVNVAAYIFLYRSLTIDTTSAQLIPGLTLFGIGMGLVLSQINNLTLSAVSIEQAGEASGVNNTLRQVGSTLGSAIIGTILIGTLGTHLVDGINASTVIPDALKAPISTSISAQSSNIEFGGGAQLGSTIPEAIKNEIVQIGHVATVEANKATLLYGAFFAILGFFISLLLPAAKAASAEKPTDGASSIVTTSPTRTLDTGLIAELIHADLERVSRGKESLGASVRALIDASDMNALTLPLAWQRLIQARLLWERGFGNVLSLNDFRTYLEGIPAIPDVLLAEDAAYPYLILVDARVSAAKAASLLTVSPKGNEQTPHMPDLQHTSHAYWMRCNTGDRFAGHSVHTAETTFAENEQGLSAQEALALFAQHPEVLADRYLDLAASRHEGFENSAGCLGRWDEKTELRWRWRDHADPRCFTVTRKR